MQEPLRLADAVAVDQHPDHPDAEGVHQHRDGDGREQQHDLVPDRPAVEHREDVREAHDREEVAQPRAGLGHLQLVDPEVDDVALEIDRHAHQLDHLHADLRRDQLQRGGDLEIQEIGQGQHEDEMQHGGPEEPAAPRPEAHEDQPEDPEDQRIEHQVIDAGEIAEQREPEGGQDQRRARPAVGRRGGGHELQLAQEHVEGKDRDHRPMAELRPGPFLGEAGETHPEQRQGRDDREPEPGEAAGIRLDRSARTPRLRRDGHPGPRHTVLPCTRGPGRKHDAEPPFRSIGQTDAKNEAPRDGKVNGALWSGPRAVRTGSRRTCPPR